MANKPSKASSDSRPAQRPGEPDRHDQLPGFEAPPLTQAAARAEDPGAQVEARRRAERAAEELPDAPARDGETGVAVGGTAARPAPTATDVPSPARGAGATATAGWRFGRSELMALGGIAVLGILSTVWFFRYLYAHPAEVGLPTVAKQFTFPLKGQVVTLTEVETGWRNRLEADRVRAEEVILPTVRLKLDPSASSQGFVRVEFIDSEGKIRGDIATVAIEGGKFTDGGRGELLSPDNTDATVSGTVGFSSRSLFSIYRAGEEARWSVRLREGPDYSSGPWTVFGQAQISDRKP